MMKSRSRVPFAFQDSPFRTQVTPVARAKHLQHPSITFVNFYTHCEANRDDPCSSLYTSSAMCQRLQCGSGEAVQWR